MDAGCSTATASMPLALRESCELSMMVQYATWVSSTFNGLVPNQAIARCWYQCRPVPMKASLATRRGPTEEVDNGISLRRPAVAGGDDFLPLLPDVASNPRQAGLPGSMFTVCI